MIIHAAALVLFTIGIGNDVTILDVMSSFRIAGLLALAAVQRHFVGRELDAGHARIGQCDDNPGYAEESRTPLSLRRI